MEELRAKYQNQIEDLKKKYTDEKLDIDNNIAQLRQDFEKEKEGVVEQEILPDEDPDRSQGSLFSQSEKDRNIPETDFFPEHYQYKQRYILTSVKSGLMIIDQHRAHVRILYDKYLAQIINRKGISQRVLFPEVLELSAAEAATLPSIQEDLEALGFELSHLGNHSFGIQGTPSEIGNTDPSQLIRAMIDSSMHTGNDVKDELREALALSLARMTAIPYGRVLTSEEMLLVVSELFALPSPGYTPDGLKVISVLTDIDIERKMQ